MPHSLYCVEGDFVTAHFTFNSINKEFDALAIEIWVLNLNSNLLWSHSKEEERGILIKNKNWESLNLLQRIWKIIKNPPPESCQSSSLFVIVCLPMNRKRLLIFISLFLSFSLPPCCVHRKKSDVWNMKWGKKGAGEGG